MFVRTVATLAQTLKLVLRSTSHNKKEEKTNKKIFQLKCVTAA